MDVETGWYYLQTRYYDPAIRRFINADNFELIPYLAGNIGELNLYSYCNNNPVMYTDETGQFVLSLFLAAVISGVIIGGIYGGMTAEANGQNFWAGVGIGALAGGLMGAVGYFLTPVVFAGGMSTVIGLSSTFVLSSVIGFGADASLQQINYGSVDWKSAAWSGVQWGALNTLNVLTAGMAGNLSAGAVFALGLFANAMYGALGILGDVIRGRQPNQFIYT